MEVYFVTSNKNKFLEVKEILRDVVNLKQLNLELLEIQSDSLEEIARVKVAYAFKRIQKPLIVEDAGLFIESLNGFPGPYSKYVFKTIGNEGILKLLKGVTNRKAYFKAVVGYYDGRELKLFEGKVDGYISEEIRGDKGFGFDPIFIPEEYNKTFAEDYELKKRISHRKRAFEKLRDWLINYK